MIEILLFDSAFYGRVLLTFISVSLLKSSLRVIRVIPLKL